MGAKEGELRGNVIKILAPLNAFPVEPGDFGGVPGTPDVNCFAGWIELKREYKWPKRPETPLRIPTWAPGEQVGINQRLWIKQCYRRGGKSWVLVQVAHDYVLLDGMVAHDNLHHTPEQPLIDMSDAHWPSLQETRVGLLTYMERYATAPAYRRV